MEQTSNAAKATLNQGGTLNSTDTSITVTSEVNVPSGGTFRALIESEIIKVTNVATHVWTIVRGQEGTTAATHADGTEIDIILTKEAVDSIVSIQLSGTEVSNRRILNFDGGSFDVTDNSGSSRADISAVNPSNFGEVIVAPVIGSLTFDGHSITGTPTLTQQGRSLYMYHPGTTSDALVEVYQTPPATPYSFIVKLIPFSLKYNYIQVGLYFGDGTKYVIFSLELFDGQFSVNHYSAWNA